METQQPPSPFLISTTMLIGIPLSVSLLWFAGNMTSLYPYAENPGAPSLLANIVIGSLTITAIAAVLILMINGSHLIGSSLERFTRGLKVKQGEDMPETSLSYHMQIVVGLPFFLIGAISMCMVAYTTGKSAILISSAFFF